MLDLEEIFKTQGNVSAKYKCIYWGNRWKNYPDFTENESQNSIHNKFKYINNT